MKNFITYFIFIFSGVVCSAQKNVERQPDLKPNQYVLSVSGDTINRTDKDGMRFGIWNIQTISRYGDETFFEVGHFVENKKNGDWKTYNGNGRLLKTEKYFNNYKNGEVTFYDNGQLVCRGFYKALRTDVAYDTIMVESPLDNSLSQKIVPTSLGSVKHGVWTYYKPPYNKIIKVEEYQVNELIYSHDYEATLDSTIVNKRKALLPHKSKKTPAAFWIKDKKKKPARYTDFPANTNYVKPNPGKKKH